MGHSNQTTKCGAVIHAGKDVENRSATAILSNGSPPMLTALVERSRLETMFDAVLSGRHGRRLEDPPRRCLL